MHIGKLKIYEKKHNEQYFKLNNFNDIDKCFVKWSLASSKCI